MDGVNQQMGKLGLNIIKNILSLIISLFFVTCSEKQNSDSIYDYLNQTNCNSHFSKKIKIKNKDVCYLDFDFSEEAKRDLFILNEFNSNNIDLSDSTTVFKKIDLIFNNTDKKIIRFNLYYSIKENTKIEKTLKYIFKKYSEHIDIISKEKHDKIFDKLNTKQKLDIIGNNDLLIMVSPIYETFVPAVKPPVE